MDKVGHLSPGPERAVEFGAALGWVNGGEAITIPPCLPADATVRGAQGYCGQVPQWEPGTAGDLLYQEKCHQQEF